MEDLRIKHCILKKLKSDIVKEYSEEIIKQLRAKLSKSIKQSTATRHNRSRQYEGLEIATENCYHQTVQKKVRLFLSATKINLLIALKPLGFLT